jgi:hypothetical protein
MKKIELFENFNNNVKPKYDDSQWWLNYLYPEEIAYTIIYSKFAKNPIIETETTYWPDWVLYNEDDDYQHTEFEGFITTKVMDIYSEVIIDGAFSGGFTPYIPGNYMDPPEGGDAIVDDYELGRIIYSDYYSEKEEEIVIEGGKVTNSYEMKSNIITPELIEEIAMILVEDSISGENESTFKFTNIRQFPEKLIEKIDGIRKKYRREIFILNR